MVNWTDINNIVWDEKEHTMKIYDNQKVLVYDKVTSWDNFVFSCGKKEKAEREVKEKLNKEIAKE